MTMTITFGGFEDLKGMTRQWGHDYQTALYYIRNAKRRKQILVMKSMMDGYTQIVRMPKDAFDLEKHKIPNRYKEQHGKLMSPIKNDMIYVFGDREVLGDWLTEVDEAEIDLMMPKIGGEDGKENRGIREKAPEARSDVRAETPRTDQRNRKGPKRSRHKRRRAQQQSPGVPGPSDD